MRGPSAIFFLLEMLVAIVFIESYWPKSYTDEECLSPCTKRGYDYYWCNTQSGWGYCSPFHNVSAHGKACKWHHPCSYKSKDIQHLQCELEDGGFDHCSNNAYVENHAISSMLEAFCSSPCRKGGYNYYWCYTSKGWDYCSPQRDITYQGEPCRVDHFCARHGKKYNWCYTASGWDYCGIVIDCAYWPAEDEPGTTRECVIRQNGRQIEFKYEPDITIDQRRNNTLHQEALKIIDDWHHTKIERKFMAGNLIRHEKMRIDQGFANGRSQATLLLQFIDNPDYPGTGSTLAKVLIPTDITLNPQFVRRAFVNSLNRRAMVTLNITAITSCSAHILTCLRWFLANLE